MPGRSLLKFIRQLLIENGGGEFGSDGRLIGRRPHGRMRERVRGRPSGSTRLGAKPSGHLPEALYSEIDWGIYI